jgi:hypothetical protein
MKLNQLSEQNLGPLSGSIFKTSGQHVDDTNSLVAYRMRMNGRVNYLWIINVRGQVLASISKRDSKWVHDNWDFTYFGRDQQNIMTRDNRKYLDSMIRQLTSEIKKAISEKRADVVVLPIDPSKL